MIRHAIIHNLSVLLACYRPTVNSMLYGYASLVDTTGVRVPVFHFCSRDSLVFFFFFKYLMIRYAIIETDFTIVIFFDDMFKYAECRI